MDDEKILLEFDDGEEIEVDVLGTFEADGREYVAVAPDDESGDVFLFRLEETAKSEDNEFGLVDIIDDAEFEKASAAFDALVTADEDDDEPEE